MAIDVSHCGYGATAKESFENKKALSTLLRPYQPVVAKMPSLTTLLKRAALSLLIVCTTLLGGCGASSEAPGQVSVTPGTPVPQAEEPPCLAI